MTKPSSFHWKCRATNIDIVHVKYWYLVHFIDNANKRIEIHFFSKIQRKELRTVSKPGLWAKWSEAVVSSPLHPRDTHQDSIIDGGISDQILGHNLYYIDSSHHQLPLHSGVIVGGLCHPSILIHIILPICFHYFIRQLFFSYAKPFNELVFQ